MRKIIISLVLMGVFGALTSLTCPREILTGEYATCVFSSLSDANYTISCSSKDTVRLVDPVIPVEKGRYDVNLGAVGVKEGKGLIICRYDGWIVGSEFQVRESPVRIEAAVGPAPGGKESSLRLSVENGTDKDLNFRVEYEFPPSVSVSGPETLTVKAGDKADLNVRYVLPPGIFGEYTGRIILKADLNGERTFVKEVRLSLLPQIPLWPLILLVVVIGGLLLLKR